MITIFSGLCVSSRVGNSDTPFLPCLSGSSNTVVLPQRPSSMILISLPASFCCNILVHLIPQGNLSPFSGLYPHVLESPKHNTCCMCPPPVYLPSLRSMDFIINPHISYLICSNCLSTCWSIQLISYYVNRDCVFFIFPVIILDNKQKRGCEKTRLSSFTAPIYMPYRRHHQVRLLYLHI